MTYLISSRIKVFGISIFVATLYSCSSEPNNQTGKVGDSAQRPKIYTAKKALNPPVSPEKTVEKFLSWYSANHEKLPHEFIENVGVRDSTKFYAVNTAGTERWLAAVNSSGFFSEIYLRDWRRYFQQFADTLRLHKQNDGPARGFEFDFLILSQEPETVVTELQHGTFTTEFPGPNRAVVEARGPQHDGWREGLTFRLSSTDKGQWQIDSVAVPTDLIR